MMMRKEDRRICDNLPARWPDRMRNIPVEFYCSIEIDGIEFQFHYTGDRETTDVEAIQRAASKLKEATSWVGARWK